MLSLLDLGTRVKFQDGNRLHILCEKIDIENVISVIEVENTNDFDFLVFECLFQVRPSNFVIYFNV